MTDADFDDRLRRSLVGAWHQYLVALDPFRADLFRYCRGLTGNVWDAEDLVRSIRVYALCPDVVGEIGARLGHPTLTIGYRFPFDVSQAS